jgi:predicted MFS family arabinose efflux permease
LWGLSHKVTLPWLAGAGIFCCICMAVPLVHLVPLGTDIGLSPETATGLLLALMISGMFGRIFFGLLADRIGGLKSYLIATLGQTASVFWFVQTESLTLLFPLAVVFGFGFSGVMTSLLICAREAAPLRIAGFATAVVSTTAWFGMGIGSFQGGYFYDLTGTYTLSYANAAFAGLVNIAIVLALLWYRQKRRPAATSAKERSSAGQTIPATS